MASSEEDEIALQSKLGESEVLLRSRSDSTDIEINEIRKLYPSLFEEAMNSGDPMILKAILESILADTCCAEYVKLATETNLAFETIEHASGKENVISFFSSYIISIPDCLFLIHGWKIFGRTESSSCLVFSFSLSGTKVYNIPTFLPNETTLNAKKCSAISMATPSIKFRGRSRTAKYDSKKRGKRYTIGEHISSNAVCFPIDIIEHLTNKNLKDDLLSHGSLLSEAVQVNIQGMMRFYIDKNDEIVKIKWLYKSPS